MFTIITAFLIRFRYMRNKNKHRLVVVPPGFCHHDFDSQVLKEAASRGYNILVSSELAATKLAERLEREFNCRASNRRVVLVDDLRRKGARNLEICSMVTSCTLGEDDLKGVPYEIQRKIVNGFVSVSFRRKDRKYANLKVR